MKITDYARNVMDLLDAEFRNRRNDVDFRVQNYRCDLGDLTEIGRTHFIEPTACGFTVAELQIILDAKFCSGANCHAFVMPDVVVKWYSGYGWHHNASASTDENVYQDALSLGMQAHFAQTVRLGRFIIQERVVTAQHLYHAGALTADQYQAAQRMIDTIGQRLDLGDLHWANWGFRPDDTEFTTPVIFDFSHFNEDE